MNKEKIEEILKRYKLINLENELYIKKIINSLGRCNKGEYIYPYDDMYWLFRENKDYIYSVLDACVKEKMLETTIILECCRCRKIVQLEKYLGKCKEYICNECGAENNQTDCIRGYIVL